MEEGLFGAAETKGAMQEEMDRKKPQTMPTTDCSFRAWNQVNAL